MRWQQFVASSMELADSGTADSNVDSQGIPIKNVAVFHVAVGLFLFLFVEESRSLSRCLLPIQHDEKTRSIRVVTLNCAGGHAGLIQELQEQNPDFILLQEVPSEDRVRDWADEIFGIEGELIWGVDCCILARGQLSAIGNSREQSFVQGLWQFDSENQIRVISLRLTTPPIRLDPWKPEFWSEYSQLRNRQRSELQPVVQQQQLFAMTDAAIIGGDFNSPATDPSIELLNAQGLKDAFHSAGRGWGNTMTNDFPLHRIDRIMTSNHFQAVVVKAVRSQYSDHRLVVCDLKVWIFSN